MTERKGAYSTPAIIAAITVGGFAIWMAFLAAVWGVLKAAGSTANFWEMTGALSTAAVVTAVVVAGYVANREFAELASTRHMEIADKLFEEMNSAENIAARRWVFQELPADPKQAMEALTQEEKDTIKRVLNSLDRIAFLTQSGWIPEEMVMPWMNSMVVKSWAKLEPYVQYESKRRHEPDYYENVRLLGERCVAWRKTMRPDAQVTWLENAL